MKRLKENRVTSFIAVACVYVIAAVIGILVYGALSLPWWISLLIADVIATVAVFIFSILFANASVYDPYWSVQPPVILISFAVGRELTALGVLLIIAVSFWAIRLTANWAYTFKNLYSQDWRYTMLREKTGAFYPIINFLGIHMVPTLVVYGCTVPAVYAILGSVTVTVGGIVFVSISILSAILQCASDIQMHSFRKNPDGLFIRRGLWRYSRHPNYLGEILMWWGVSLSVLCSVPSEIYLLSGAFANTVLFLAVSIPMADARQSRKEGFAEYKAETRMLLPIYKRRK